MMLNKRRLETIVCAPCWPLEGVDLGVFFRQISTFAVPGSVLCLESVISEEVKNFLVRYPAVYPNSTRTNWFGWETFDFYIPITQEALFVIAEISDRYAEIEVCSSLQVHSDDTIAMSWHDLPDDPIYVSLDFDETSVRDSAARLNCQYSTLKS